MPRADVSPITEADLPRVGEFLHTNLNNRLSASEWASAARVPWPVSQAPNHGFMLVAEGLIVGVYLAFYSVREIEGRMERFCNLGAWCVLPRYRLYSLSLLKAILGQDGYHFTDFSPSGNTITVNERLGFKRLDTTTALVPNLPWPTFATKAEVTSDPIAIASRLGPAELEVFRHHEGARAAHHVLIESENECAYVIFRRDRRKGLRLFASVLYVSNPGLFLRVQGAFGGHLLLRLGIPVTLIELRLVGSKPSGGVLLSSPRPKMFRSDTLSPRHIDNLYSELVCVAW